MKKFMQVKKFMQKKQVQMFLVLTMICSMMAVGASAAEGDVTNATITTAFTTGFSSLASDALTMIAAIVPIALGVAGTIFLVKKAMGWFKSLTK